MKRFFSFIVVCMFALCSFAQATTNLFALSPDGGFVNAKDGKDFAVVNFEKKTATELFQMLFKNAGIVYQRAEGKVIITLDGNVFNVRANDTEMTFQQAGVMLRGTYEIKFEVRDGRIKVSAPTCDEVLTRNKDDVREKDFSKLVRSWYTDGKLQAKYNEQAAYTTKELNDFVNGILQGKAPAKATDW